MSGSVPLGVNLLMRTMLESRVRWRSPLWGDRHRPMGVLRIS